MTTCHTCQQRKHLYCQKCADSRLQMTAKLLSDAQKQISSNQRGIETYLNSNFQAERKRLEQTHQIMYTQKKKSYLRQIISKKMEQNRAKKQNLKIGQLTFQKRQKTIDQMKVQERKILFKIQASKQSISSTTKQIKQATQKNMLIVSGKVKDIQFSLINEQDKRLIDSALQIKESQEQQISLAYQFLNVLDIVKYQSVRPKDSEKYMNYREVRAVNRSTTILACLVRIFDFWLPHQITYEGSLLKIKGEQLIIDSRSKIIGLHKLKVSTKFLNLLQANIEFLARSINYQEEPFMCFSKKFLRTLSVKQNIIGQRYTQRRFKQQWQTLRVEAIEKLIIRQINAYDSCLPPLHPITSNSQKGSGSDSEQYQLL